MTERCSSIETQQWRSLNMRQAQKSWPAAEYGRPLALHGERQLAPATPGWNVDSIAFVQRASTQKHITTGMTLGRTALNAAPGPVARAVPSLNQSGS